MRNNTRTWEIQNSNRLHGGMENKSIRKVNPAYDKTQIGNKNVLKYT